jgi:hypothetical protein
MMLKRYASMTIIGVGVATGCGTTPAADQDTVALASPSVVSVGYDGIPRNAMRVSSGKGTLRFRAGRDGTVWIGDDDLGRQLLREAVQRDDVVEVDPYANHITINNRQVSRGGLTKGHRHSIFHLDARQEPRAE